MKAEKLMQIIGDAEDGFVQSALDSRTQKREHRGLSLVSKVVLVAAIILSLAATAYAADFLGLRLSILDDHGRSYSSFGDLGRAMEEAGFQVDVKEKFGNGYAFDLVDVDDLSIQDEAGNREPVCTQLCIRYKNASGHKLLLIAQQDRGQSFLVTESRKIGEIIVDYHEGTQRIYPLEKAGQLTEEEEAWLKQPGNSIGYGSSIDTVVETKFSTLTWVKDGIWYRIQDLDGAEPADTLFSMAEELIPES